MPDETTAAVAEVDEAQAPSAPDASPPQGEDGEGADANAWIRETASGVFYSRPAETESLSKQWNDANAELRRGRRPKEESAEDGSDDQQPTEGAAPADERGERPTPADAQRESRQVAGEATDERFNRAVQAEVDRREAEREARFERELQRKNPEEYARYKANQQNVQTVNANVTKALTSMSSQFDTAVVKPIMDALTEKDREDVLKDAGHGIAQRKTLANRAIPLLQRRAYDDGYAKGKAEAEKALRKSPSFRKELLSELRGEDDEPVQVGSNGRSSNPSDWDMNDWMRGSLRRSK